MRARAGRAAEAWSGGTLVRVAGPAEKSVDGAVRGAARRSGRGAMRLTARALCGAARAAWRESFPLDGRDVARWFPGHMAKGEVRRDATGPRCLPGSSRVPRERGGRGSQGPSATRLPKPQFMHLLWKR